MGIMTLMLCSLVSAIAVSAPYTPKSPLSMYPGESKTFTLTLQNMAGEEDVKFDASVAQGSEIVSLVRGNKEYLVPIGSNNVPVEVKVKVPKNAEVGTEYLAQVKFEPIPLGTEEEGMVQLALGISGYFKVNVVEKPEGVKEGLSTTTWIIILVILIVLVLVGIWMAKKKKPVTPTTKQIK